MAILKTYDLKGNKLSFANWISNLSPVETPFASMIGKESVDQVVYSWQTDRLSSPTNTGTQEGAAFGNPLLAPTKIFSNFTQILRKAVRISDTANKIGLYGRDSEKAYRMEKAGKEIKRDLEMAMLQQRIGTMGSKGAAARTFSGFQALVAQEGQACPDTGAVVHKAYEYAGGAPAFTEVQIFDITYNLYLVGSKANKIMIHPVHMEIFSDMIGDSQNTSVKRMFDGLETKFNAYVKSIRDPLGQVFEIIPNRHMPVDAVYFFNEADWTQMVLREPTTVELAKTGSSEKHMIEMEVGLRHRNPFASGILRLKSAAAGDKFAIHAAPSHSVIETGAGGQKAKLQVTMYKNGVIDTTTATTAADFDLAVNPSAGLRLPSAAGNFAAGVFTFDADMVASVAGSYTVSVDHKTNGARSVFEILAHSKDRMAPGGGTTSLAEELEVAMVEAPVAKAVKVKAKKA